MTLNEAHDKKEKQRKARRRRYVHVSSNLTKVLRRRKVSVEQMRVLMDKAKSLDVGGIFLETDELLETEEVVEVSFVYPDGKKEADALGIVEWLGKEKEKSGVGIRFIRVDTRKRESPKKKPVRLASSFSVLLLSNLSQKMLKLYFSELDRECEMSYITRKCGASKKLIEKTLGEFEYLGLIETIKVNELVKFVRPENEELWNQIADWVRKHGLT